MIFIAVVIRVFRNEYVYCILYLPSYGLHVIDLFKMTPFNLHKCPFLIKSSETACTGRSNSEKCRNFTAALIQ